MATIGERNPEHEQFWELAEPHLAGGRLIEGTMMGHQCLRTAATNGFVATVIRASGNVVVKLPKTRVTELIEQGVGLAFAPAGKVFREWVELPAIDEATWETLLTESNAFVDGVS
ncbi:MAG: hypothetical protein O3C27_06365 [Actinomycetota bacterium]|nr:hypothetical protein [Actinomycetota bacterium]